MKTAKLTPPSAGQNLKLGSNNLYLAFEFSFKGSLGCCRPIEATSTGGVKC